MKKKFKSHKREQNRMNTKMKAIKMTKKKREMRKTDNKETI